MTNINVKLGTCFDGKTPPNGSHPFFVITHPDSEGKVLAVNITEYDYEKQKDNPHIDTSCIIYAFEHSRVTKTSRVNYKQSLITSVNKIKLEGKNIVNDSLMIPLLKKIYIGMIRTKAIPKKHKNYFDINKDKTISLN